MNPDQRSLFGYLLSRQGAQVLRTALSGHSRQYLAALRHCKECKSFARCESWLESGAREAYEDFCPNAGFVSYLKDLVD